MAGPRHGQKVKGQGHRVMECAAGVGMHVDMTALGFWFMIVELSCCLWTDGDRLTV